jgi:hypothetical protein
MAQYYGGGVATLGPFLRGDGATDVQEPDAEEPNGEEPYMDELYSW